MVRTTGSEGSFSCSLGVSSIAEESDEEEESEDEEESDGETDSRVMDGDSSVGVFLQPARNSRTADTIRQNNRNMSFLMGITSQPK